MRRLVFCWFALNACASGGSGTLRNDVGTADSGAVDAQIQDTSFDSGTVGDSAVDTRIDGNTHVDAVVADLAIDRGTDTAAPVDAGTDTSTATDSGYVPTVRNLPNGVQALRVGEDTSRNIAWDRPTGSVCPAGAPVGNSMHCYYVEMVFRNIGDTRDFTFTVEDAASLSDTVMFLYRSARVPADPRMCAEINDDISISNHLSSIREVTIAANETVTLVVSAFQPDTHGSFSVRVSGVS